MPRLSRIRTTELEDLADQLRYASSATVVRQIERLADIARTIDPARVYAHAWFVRALTGFAPAQESDVQLVGAALLGDLSAIAERLSASAKLDQSALAGKTIPLAELASRWNVTARTLERDRRRGLMAVRVLADDGSLRLEFLASSVEAVERRRARGPGATRASERRLTDDDRERIVRRARAYRRRLGWTLAQASRRLAQRHGVSVQAVRQLLQRRDARAPSPTFPAREPSTADLRRELFEAWRDGASPSALAKRAGRSAASAHRLVNERRAELLRRLDFSSSPETPASASDDAQGGPLSHPLVVAGLRTLADMADHASDGRDAPDLATPAVFIASADEAAPEEELEQARAAAYQLLRAQAAARIAALPRFGPASSALDEIETRLRWATMLKAELVRSVLGVASRGVRDRLGDLSLVPPAELAIARRAAIDAAIHAIDRHDALRPAKRGGRLAAPVSVAVARALATPGAPAPSLLAAVEWTHRVTPWQSLVEAPAWLARAVSRGVPSARAADGLSLRFGLAGERPRTLAELEREHRLTVAQLTSWIRAARAAHDQQHALPTAR